MNAGLEEIAFEVENMDAVTGDAASSVTEMMVSPQTPQTVTAIAIWISSMAAEPWDYNLWVGGVIPLAQLKEIVSEVIGQLLHRKNSGAMQIPYGNLAAMHQRIARTTKRVENTAQQLKQFGSETAAWYLQGWLQSLVMFAEYVLG